MWEILTGLQHVVSLLREFLPKMDSAPDASVARRNLQVASLRNRQPCLKWLPNGIAHAHAL